MFLCAQSDNTGRSINRNYSLQIKSHTFVSLCERQTIYITSTGNWNSSIGINGIITNCYTFLLHIHVCVCVYARVFLLHILIIVGNKITLVQITEVKSKNLCLLITDMQN